MDRDLVHPKRFSMKFLLFALLLVHGLIHTIGVTKAWNPGQIRQATLLLSRPGGSVVGALWLTVLLIFLFTAMAVLLNKDWWWAPATIGILVSQILIIQQWKDAKWGTIANIIIAIVAFSSFVTWRFQNTSEKEAMTILSKSKRPGVIINNGMLTRLPMPVQRWIRQSGVLGKEQIHTVRLRQQGQIRNDRNQEKWVKMSAVQYFNADDPAFVWTVTMDLMPGLPVLGRDYFKSGMGNMKIVIPGIKTISDESGQRIDEGTLQRFLAEICWFPSAALNSYITWTPIDDYSAKATMKYGPTTGSVIFHFTDAGDIKMIEALRYMGGGPNAKKELWQIESDTYGVFNGVRIPISSVATWKLKDEDFTWLKLNITAIDYNTPSLY